MERTDLKVNEIIAHETLSGTYGIILKRQKKLTTSKRVFILETIPISIENSTLNKSLTVANVFFFFTSNRVGFGTAA